MDSFLDEHIRRRGKGGKSGPWYRPGSRGAETLDKDQSPRGDIVDSFGAAFDFDLNDEEGLGRFFVGLRREGINFAAHPTASFGSVISSEKCSAVNSKLGRDKTHTVTAGEAFEYWRSKKRWQEEFSATARAGEPCEISESYWNGKERVHKTVPGFTVKHTPRKTWRVFIPYAEMIDASKTGKASMRPVVSDYLTRLAELCDAPEFDPCLSKLEQPIFSNRGPVFPSAADVPFEGYIDEIREIKRGHFIVGKHRYGYIEYRDGGFLNFRALKDLPAPSRLAHLVIGAQIGGEKKPRARQAYSGPFDINGVIDALFNDRRVMTAFDLRAAIEAATGGLENVNDKGRDGATYACCPLCDSHHEHHGPQQFRMFDGEPGRKSLSCSCFDSACPLYEGNGDGVDRVKALLWRGNQDERAASIRMRMRRGWADGGRA